MASSVPRKADIKSGLMGSYHMNSAHGEHLDGTANFGAMENANQTGISFRSINVQNTRSNNNKQDKRMSQTLMTRMEPSMLNSTDNTMTFGQRQKKTYRVQSIEGPGVRSTNINLPTVQQNRNALVSSYEQQEPHKESKSMSMGGKRNVAMNHSFYTAPHSTVSPVSTLAQDQEKAASRLKQFQKGARIHDSNIEKILLQNRTEWTSLYTHPKLMSQYYWKDDKILTRQQRMNEIKNAIKSDRITTKRIVDVGLHRKGPAENDLSKPLERPFRPEYSYPMRSQQSVEYTEEDQQ